MVKQIDLGPLQSAGELYVGILAATILFIATNAAIIGVSRLVYSMGIHRQLPDALRQLHPRFRTPWIGILIFSGVAILTILPGQADFLGLMYAFGAMLSFTIAHFAVITLRFTQPDVPRPYRGPWNVPFRGRQLPMFAVVGGTATGLAFVATSSSIPMSRPPASPGSPSASCCIRSTAAPGPRPPSTHKVAIAAPVVDHEAEYDSVLVQSATPARRAAPRHRGQARRPQAPRNPRARDDHRPERHGHRRALPEAEAAADRSSSRPGLQAGNRVSGHWEKVRGGQAGRRIIEEAEPCAPRQSS